LVITNSTDTVNGSWNYMYDSLNRLTCAWVGSECNSSATTALSWTYDQFDNRYKQTMLAGTGYNVNNTYNGLNHITTAGYTYDAAGNVTHDTFHAYTYDAEGRLLTVDGGVGNGGETYNYNSRGLRNLTHQSVWQEVLYNVDGSQEAMVLPGTNTLSWSEFYAYRHIGTFTAGGLNTTLFLLPDWLGTNRYWMTQAGAYYTSSATLPYGEILSPGIGDGWTGISGLFLDYADNTVHTDARQLSLNSGRWITSDPVIMTGNRYAYVTNNPVGFTDPTGLQSQSSNPCPIAPNQVQAVCQGGYGTAFFFGVTSGWDQFDVGWSYTDEDGFVSSNAPVGQGGGNFSSGSAANNGPQKACPAVPAHPANANVNSNISETNFVYYANWLNPPTQAAFTDAWLVSQVRPNGPWDYKTQGQQYDAFGNFNFGATGGAAGIPLQVLQAGAGAVSTLVGTNSSQYGSWYQPPLYGHAPIKSDMIAAGYAYYQQGCK
jgi:RHS repeat-associated protein